MNTIRTMLLTVLLFAMFAERGLAQTGRASLTGTVTDQSNQVVPGATVIATNTATGVASETETTGAGLYVLLNLIPGTYTLNVDAKGFARKELANIDLSVNQQAKVDVQLALSVVTQEVQVTSAAAPLLQTEDAAVGMVITGKSTTDLPLNGRFYTQLLELAPGAVPALRGRQISSSDPNLAGKGRNGSPVYNINGQEERYTNFWLDGVSNNEHQFNSASNIPFSIDAIQEFKLQDSNFSAEYGQSGIQVVVVGKSGTNRFHGKLFEFLRNDCCGLVASQWTFTGPHGKQLLKRNQFGGNLGGPIKKNKLFFFGSFDGTREIISNPQVQTVPTTDMRNGIFPAGNPIIDWMTGQPFQNNTIPQERLSSISSKEEKFWPTPNLPGQQIFTKDGLLQNTINNFFFNPVRTQSINQGNGRIDYILSEKDSFFVRYTRSPNFIHMPISGNYFKYDNWNQSGSNLGSAWYHNFNPTTINEFRFGFSADPQDFEPGDTIDYAAQFGLVPFLFPGYPGGMPDFNISGFGSVASGDFRPLISTENDWQLIDNLTLVRGRHNLRVGGVYRRQVMHDILCNVCRGYFAFNGKQTWDRRTVTFNGQNINLGNRGTTYCPGGTDPTACTAGNGWADFLLGYLDRYQVGNTTRSNFYANSYSFYINDTWKVRPRLTVTLGLRYDLPAIVHGDPSYAIAPVIAGGTNGDFTGKVGVADSSLANIPASELAYAPGIYVSCSSLGLPSGTCERGFHSELQPRIGFAWQVQSKTVIRGGAGIYYSDLGDGNQVLASKNGYPFQLNHDTFNLRTPTGNNPPPVQFSNTAGLGQANNLAQPFFLATDPNTKFPLTYQWNLTVERKITNDTVASVGYVANLGRHVEDFPENCCYYDVPQPWGVVLAPGQQLTQVDPRFTFIEVRQTQNTSSYNSLQAKLEHRFSAGLTLTSSFTWSKAMWIYTGLTDLRNARLDKSVTDTDVPYTFVTSSVWELPFGQGKHWANVNGPLNQMIGGWRLSNIITAYAGFPFNPTIGLDLLNRSGFEGEDRPDRTCSGTLSHPTLQNWFNKSCFTVPIEPTTPGALLREGTAGHNILRTPGAFGWDLSLAKTFPVTERFNLEFRTEAFNFLNHPTHLVTPSRGISVSGNNSPASITGVSSLPRIIQFALKLHF